MGAIFSPKNHPPWPRRRSNMGRETYLLPVTWEREPMEWHSLGPEADPRDQDEHMATFLRRTIDKNPGGRLWVQSSFELGNVKCHSTVMTYVDRWPVSIFGNGHGPDGIPRPKSMSHANFGSDRDSLFVVGKCPSYSCLNLANLT